MAPRNNSRVNTNSGTRKILVCTEEDFRKPKEARPPCPYCGSNHILSSSNKWLCADCGRSKTKFALLRPRPADPDKTRPPCLYCGSDDILSNHFRWVCKTCKRGRMKNPVPKKTLPSPPCFYCGEKTTSMGSRVSCTVCYKTRRKTLHAEWFKSQVQSS